jgi:hypothetical protein
MIIHNFYCIIIFYLKVNLGFLQQYKNISEVEKDWNYFQMICKKNIFGLKLI